jgi:hypothetical protein
MNKSIAKAEGKMNQKKVRWGIGFSLTFRRAGENMIGATLSPPRSDGYY